MIKASEAKELANKSRERIYTNNMKTICTMIVNTAENGKKLARFSMSDYNDTDRIFDELRRLGYNVNQGSEVFYVSWM